MEEISFTYTQNGGVIIDGEFKGTLQKLQKVIQAERMDLVQKHKIKAIYIGNASFRYISDWESIIKEYYGFSEQQGEGEERDQAADTDD